MTMLFHCGNGSCEGLQLAAEGYTFLLCAIDDPPIERSLLQATKQLMQLELEVLETIASLLVVGYYEQSHNQNECSCLTALMNIGQLDKLHSALQPGQHSLEQYEIMLGIQLPTDKLPDKTIQLKLHQYHSLLSKTVNYFYYTIPVHQKTGKRATEETDHSVEPSRVTRNPSRAQPDNHSGAATAADY